MKRNRLILATIPLVVLGILALVKLFPRTVPLEECSPLYRQYAGHEDIEATFVKDYPVDDTTLVDVPPTPPGKACVTSSSYQNSLTWSLRISYMVILSPNGLPQ